MSVAQEGADTDLAPAELAGCSQPDLRPATIQQAVNSTGRLRQLSASASRVQWSQLLASKRNESSWDKQIRRPTQTVCVKWQQ